jgi:hypothetical protein
MEAHGGQNRFEQQLAGVRIVEDCGHGRASVVIHDFHGVRIPVTPDKFP